MGFRALANPIDQAIIVELREDPRMTNVEIARRLNISEAAVRLRLARLLEAKAIRIAVLADLAALGYTMVSEVRLSVRPHAVRSTMGRLAGASNVVYIAHTTGRFDLFGYVISRDADDLALFLEERISPFDEILEVRVNQVREAIKYSFEDVVLRTNS